MMKTSATSRIERFAATNNRGAEIYANVFHRFGNGSYSRYMVEWSRATGWVATHVAPERYRHFIPVNAELRMERAAFLLATFYPNPEVTEN